MRTCVPVVALSLASIFGLAACGGGGNSTQGFNDPAKLAASVKDIAARGCSGSACTPLPSPTSPGAGPSTIDTVKCTRQLGQDFLCVETFTDAPFTLPVHETVSPGGRAWKTPPSQ
jgi:hypothetical protein